MRVLFRAFRGMRDKIKVGDLREYKAIAIDIVRVLRVEGHEFVEEDMRHWGHAHGGTRMAGICFERRIDLAFR